MRCSNPSPTLRHRQLLCVAILALSSASLRAQDSGPAATTPLSPRVLVVSGANNHDWAWTTPSLVGILERSGRFAVDVTYEPAVTFASEGGLDGYAALILDYNGPRWGEVAEARFLAAIAEDHTGVVVVHAADNAFSGWIEYEELVGDLWREGTSHGSFHAFDITFEDRDHSITATLPNLLKHPDELYHNLINTQGVPRRVLGAAFSDPATKGSGKHEPMVIVKEWRGARVFHTPLGHVWTNNATSQASHRDPQFQALLVRGTEWAATGAVSDELVLPMSAGDQTAGWSSLMDPALWRPRDPSRDHRWTKTSDCLVLGNGAGSQDLVTAAAFGDFELEFDWKASIAGNSGVKYLVPDGDGAIVAPEYQLLDGAAEVGALHRAGGLYDLYESEAPQLAPFGFFNRSRIIVQGRHVEHWLNGVRTVSTTLGGADFERRRAASKFRDQATFGAASTGHIALQDHGDEVWFRDVRVRDLSALAARAEDVLPPADLAGWTRVGDAVFERQGDELRGQFGPRQRQSFLVSERIVGDFRFEVELRFESEGNSGLQVRSHVIDGRMVGYQFEVDPTARSWSGGLYEEGRRGWLASLEHDEVARATFDRAGWNRYVIECVGPHLRAWVNGVQTCDHLDGQDLTGHLGFQVHGGDPDIAMRWRKARLVSFGEHGWVPHTSFLLEGAELMPGERHWLAPLEGAAGLRWTQSGGGGALALGDREIDLTAATNWRAEGDNEVTVLVHDARASVQVDGKTFVELKRAVTPGPIGEPWLAVGLSAPVGTSVSNWRRLVVK